MTDERQIEPSGERQAERETQLSAMFDGELPGGECELLARRLTRDDALRAQWSRYSMIGAALRAERGVALHDRVAVRVQSAIAKEVTYGEGGAEVTREVKVASVSSTKRRGFSRFAYPLAGASIAAGVAAVSIFWLRGVQDPLEGSLQANTNSPTTIVLTPDAVVADNTASTVALDNTPDAASADYSTPAPGSSNSIAPNARLANYVVAHSEYSGPLTRRMALVGIVGAESGDLADEVSNSGAAAAGENDAN